MFAVLGHSRIPSLSYPPPTCRHPSIHPSLQVDKGYTEVYAVLGLARLEAGPALVVATAVEQVRPGVPPGGGREGRATALRCALPRPLAGRAFPRHGPLCALCRRPRCGATRCTA